MADSRQPGDLISDVDEILRRVNVLEKLIGSQPEISTPSLVNGWIAQAGFLAPRIYRVYNMITIVGVFNGLGLSSVTAFTLPVGWRPPDLVANSLSYWSGTIRTAGVVYIPSSGGVSMYGTGDAQVARDYYTVNMTFSTKS